MKGGTREGARLSRRASRCSLRMVGIGAVAAPAQVRVAIARPSMVTPSLSVVYDTPRRGGERPGDAPAAGVRGPCVQKGLLAIVFDGC